MVSLDIKAVKKPDHELEFTLRVYILSFSDLRVNKRVKTLRSYIPLVNGLGINKSVNSKLGDQ